MSIYLNQYTLAQEIVRGDNSHIEKIKGFPLMNLAQARLAQEIAKEKTGKDFHVINVNAE